MSWQLRVGAVQMRATNDLAANLSSCKALIERAAGDGSQLVVLPECFSFLGRGEGDKLAIAESFDVRGLPPGGSAAEGWRGSIDPPKGPIAGMLRELATKHGIWIVGGGTPERVIGDEQRTYNTALVVDPRGELVARYRKIHLFDLDIPGGVTLKESAATTAGDAPLVIEIGGAKVGVTICYDLRFPELYRQLVQDLGAEILLVPAAFTAHTGAAHWHVLLRARAIEEQAYVVAAAQWGRHNEKRESYGHTLICDPWGTIVGEQAEGDGAVVATLDGAALAKRRTQMPVLAHATLWRQRSSR